MKFSVTTTGSLVSGGARGDQIETISRGVANRLLQDLEEEMQSVLASERAADPETRRDALERAVRRIWGAAQ